MMFKEVTAVYSDSESYEAHKYKMQRYLLLNKMICVYSYHSASKG
jgi:hypothetical protein